MRSLFCTKRLKSCKIGLFSKAKLTSLNSMTFFPIRLVSKFISKSVWLLWPDKSCLRSWNRLIRACCLVARAWGWRRIQVNSAYRVAASEEGLHHARLAQPLSGHNPGSCPDTRSSQLDQLKDPRRDIIQEISIVGNEEHGFLRVLQEIGQPFDSINVQVVGRLI